MADPSNVMSETSDFPVVSTNRKSGNEKFSLNGRALEVDLLSYWQWVGSDLLSNTARGILAEFIVANALGIADKVRLEWDAYDLLSRDGTKIEVKSAAYIQSWFQKNLSKIEFGIPPTTAWDADMNRRDSERKRQADIYIFCVLAHQQRETIDPLKLDQWDFYLLPTSVLNEFCPTQKKIGLTRVLKLGAVKAKYDEIERCLRALV